VKEQIRAILALILDPTYAPVLLKSFKQFLAWSFVTLALACPATTFAQDFMGLRLGMPASEAFEVTGRDVDLSSFPVISGKRIVNDTIPIGDCGAYFRRSIAFDTLQRLKVVGLTHRTHPAKVEAVKECVLNWLTKEYGDPEIDSLTNDTVDMYVWRSADAMITMDSRPYNERHSFVLVYYLASERVARKED
jgi:hypothetical protein